MSNKLADQEVAFENNSVYEFGPQPDTGCTTAQETNIYDRIVFDERESHHPSPIYANVNF